MTELKEEVILRDGDDDEEEEEDPVFLFSGTLRFDAAHQLTIAMDPDTGDLYFSWEDEETETVKEGNYSWDNGGSPE